MGSSKEVVHVRLEQNHMATTFSFLISCEKNEGRRAERALLRAHALVHALELELTEFLAESPIYQLNRAQPGVPVALSSHAIALLERSLRLSAQTHGAFNCLAKSEVPSALGRSLAWDAETRMAWTLHDGVRLGFGAIGKGYALDQVRLSIEQEGFRDYILNAGGSSQVISGYARMGKPWSWGWSWSRSENGEPLGLEFSHESGEAIALGISGTHEKGQHILDPNQSLLAGGAQSALIAHASATDADALSTALFVSGWERGMESVQASSSTVAAAYVDQEGVARWNGIFQKLWGAVLCMALCLVPQIALAQEEEIDLSAGATDSFNPYIFDRNDLWVMLPIVAIALVMIHLKRYVPSRRRTTKGESK